jgi:hypothetical protein
MQFGKQALTVNYKIILLDCPLLQSYLKLYNVSGAASGTAFGSKNEAKDPPQLGPSDRGNLDQWTNM